ncbi:MAG: DUF433 domain-containing protein [Phycicoccus sp.]|nr:DUF433 domain-containing protein [Phycicoccus sp.]
MSVPSAIIVRKEVGTVVVEDNLRYAWGGCYDASRAAALSGVPKTTVYWWARHGIVVPSVSPVQEKLWSYSDLMCLRIVSWLRRPKVSHDDGSPLPSSPMPRVRAALNLLTQHGVDLWSSTDEHPYPLLVDVRGQIWVRLGNEIPAPTGDTPFPTLNPSGLPPPYEPPGQRAPDLIRPRPNFRIVPGKLAGEPHVQGTRLTSTALAALAAQGFSVERIGDMYEIDPVIVAEAVDLETQLRTFSPAA